MIMAEIISPDVITSVDGVRARVWKGRTAGGARFIAFIPLVSVEEGEDASEFEELAKRNAPGELAMHDVLVTFSTM